MMNTLIDKIISETIQKHKTLLQEGVESKNMKLAKHYLYDKLGYNENQAMKLLGSIKTDIPNVRLAKCKFILGVVRMYCDGQLSDGESIMKLNKTLKYVASDAHVNEYDNNLNNMSCNELVQRFASVASNDLENEKNELSQITFGGSDYKIVKIDSAEKASEYGDYTSWCVTHDEEMYDSYTNGGSGLFYFCLKDGFENVEAVASEGCPLDEYGLSMIAVSVNMDGSCNTITCRWNHSNGGNDNIMTPKELSQVIGYNFYEVFKPYTDEELESKGIISFNRAAELLKQGVDPERIFDDIWEYSYDFTAVRLNNKWNLINTNGEFLLPNQWFDDICDFENGFAAVGLNNKWNFINTNGEFLLPNHWFDVVGDFSNGFARVNLNDKWNYINTNGEYVSPNQWFDGAYDFFNGVARVILNGKWNLINTNIELVFPNQWFNFMDSFRNGFAQVRLNGEWNYINTNGELLSPNQWFDDSYYFENGFGRVKLYGTYFFLRKDGVLCDYDTYKPISDLNSVSESRLNFLISKNINKLLKEVIKR